MSRNFFRKYKKDFFVVLLCLLLTGGFTYIYLARANPSAQVQFTADTIVSLAGTSDGDLYVASSSECTSLDVLSSTLNVTEIPDGSNFTLKTPSHDQALSLTPSGASLNLTFDASNLSSGNITQWTLDGSSNLNAVDHVVGTPKSNTYYEVEVSNSSLNSYQSNASGTISFTYQGGFSSKTFTISEDNTAPTSFSLTSPTNGSTKTPEKPTFSWNASTNPDLHHYELYLNGSLKATTSSSVTSYQPNNGLSCNKNHHWYVKAVDKAGNSTKSSTFSFDINCGAVIPPSWFQPPTEPEGGFNVTIDQGATTSSREVDLTLKGGPDTTRMAISNTLDFDTNTNTGQIDYQNSYQWDLCYRQDQCSKGSHTVYVKFYNEHGQSSKIVSDTITLTERKEETEKQEKPTSEMTTEELRARVQELLATIDRLAEKLNRKRAEQEQQVNIPSGFQFTKDLEQGMTGPQVKQLQKALNQDPETQLAKQGPGSPGNETNYFGPLTKQAVIKFQEKYSREVLKPWNLQQGTGYVGRTTREKLNELY